MLERARRALGGGLFAVMSLAIGHAAWAGDPAQADGTPAATQVVKMGAKGILKFGPDAQIETYANTVSTGSNGAQILEGDVRLEITPPPGKHKTVKVMKTPQGEQRIESSDEAPRAMTVKAQKVTMTRAGDGSVTLEFENGTIEQH